MCGGTTLVGGAKPGGGADGIPPNAKGGGSWKIKIHSIFLNKL